MDYKELCEKREALKRQLAQVENDIKKYDLTIYKGKLEKAVKLLGECEPLFHNLIIMDVYTDCEECESEVNIEIYLSRIIAELSMVADNFERLARIP